MSFSENLLQMSRKSSTNSAKPLSKTTLFCLFWTVSALITSKTPKKCRALRAQGFYYISTNCSRVFYKLHFSTNCTADLRILLQMSLFSSTNVIFQKLLSTNFTDFFYKIFCNLEGGEQLTAISMVVFFAKKLSQLKLNLHFSRKDPAGNNGPSILEKTKAIL